MEILAEIDREQALLDKELATLNNIHASVTTLHEAKKEALFTLSADLEEAQCAKLMNVQHQTRRVQQEKEMLIQMEKIEELALQYRKGELELQHLEESLDWVSATSAYATELSDQSKELAKVDIASSKESKRCSALASELAILGRKELELREKTRTLAVSITAKNADRSNVLETLLQRVAKKQAIVDELKFQVEQILPAEHEQEMRRLNDELQSLEVHNRKDEEHRLEHLCQVLSNSRDHTSMQLKSLRDEIRRNQ